LQQCKEVKASVITLALVYQVDVLLHRNKNLGRVSRRSLSCAVFFALSRPQARWITDRQPSRRLYPLE
jgi:hypothetical protein